MTSGWHQILLPAVHGVGFAGMAGCFLFLLKARARPARYALLGSLSGLFGNTALIVILGGRLPLYGSFESLTTICLVAGGCLYLSSKAGPELVAGSGILALVLAAMSLFPLRLNHDFFMYASPVVQGFFFFRLLSGGVLLFAGIRFLAAAGRAREDSGGGASFRAQHRLLLAGTVLFLISELSGSIWCLKGWGDSWHWSGNFFQSAAVFFLIMINLHIPAGMFRSPGKRGALGAVSSFVVVFLFLW